MLESAALIIASSFKKPPSTRPCQRSFVYCPPNPPGEIVPRRFPLALSSSQRCLTSLLQDLTETGPDSSKALSAPQQTFPRQLKPLLLSPFLLQACRGPGLRGKAYLQARAGQAAPAHLRRAPVKRQQSSPVKSSHLFVVHRLSSETLQAFQLTPANVTVLFRTADTTSTSTASLWRSQ